MYTPGYYSGLQNPYFNPQMSFTQPQMQNQEQNYQDSNCGIIWVQGEAAAKAYPVLKNNTVALWDSESQTIYIKSVDNLGMPSMRVVEWVDKPNNKTVQENAAINVTNTAEYVTREEFDEVVKRLNSLSNKVGSNKPKINNNNNKEATENG